MEGEKKFIPPEQIKSQEITSEEELRLFLETNGITPEEGAVFKVEKTVPPLIGYDDETKKGIVEIYEPTQNKGTLIKNRVRPREVYRPHLDHGFTITKHLDRQHLEKELPPLRMAAGASLLGQDAKITYTYYSLKELKQQQEQKGYVQKLKEKLGLDTNWEIIQGFPETLNSRDMETGKIIETIYYETPDGRIQEDKLGLSVVNPEKFLPQNTRFVAVKEVVYNRLQEKTETYKLYTKE